MTNYHLTKEDSSSYEKGYEIFLKRTNFREVILKGFSERISSFSLNSKNLEVLDVGCGNGEMTKRYIESLNVEDHQYISLHLVEPSANALAEASKNLENLNTKIRPHNSTLEAYLSTNPEESFDLIIVSYVFYHLNANTVRGLISLLKPNGAIAIMMGSKDHPLRRNPILRNLSKHGDSFDLKEELASIDNVSFKVEEFKTDVILTGLVNGENVTEDGRGFFSFIYNHQIDLFSNLQLEALKQTITDLLFTDDGKAHPKHEIIWVTRR